MTESTLTLLEKKKSSKNFNYTLRIFHLTFWNYIFFFYLLSLILYSGSFRFITQKAIRKSSANGDCLLFIHQSLKLEQLIAVILKQRNLSMQLRYS